MPNRSLIEEFSCSRIEINFDSAQSLQDVGGARGAVIGETRLALAEG